MRWILRGMMLLVAVAVLAWGQDKEYGTWSAGFLLAAWGRVDRYRYPALAAALVMSF